MPISSRTVTLGPASAALYDTVVKTFRTKEETTPYRRFLQVFRRELRVEVNGGPGHRTGAGAHRLNGKGGRNHAGMLRVRAAL